MTTVVVKVKNSIVGHQVTIIKEESVEAQTGCNLEIGTYVPFVLQVEAQFIVLNT